MRTENLLFAGKISFDFPDRTINFLWRDDMFSTRGRYIFPWGTALLPGLDAKISLRGRQFFLGRTIGPRPKISQERRYSFPRRTIFCCVHAQELRVRVLGVPITRISSQARRYAPGGGGGRSLVVRERDDMGTLGPQCFPEGTILAVELACRSRATGAGVSAYRPPGEGRRHYHSFQNTPYLLPQSLYGVLGSSLPASNAQAKLIAHKNSPFGGCGQDLRPLYCPTVGVGECPKKRGRRGVHGVRRTESLLEWAP